MENNRVELTGVIKRDAQAENGLLDFAIGVTNRNGRVDVFDCLTTQREQAYEALEGFVEGGERMTVIGHLQKRTRTCNERLGAVAVEARYSATIVYVEEIKED